jgi:hypothetical protein
MSSTPKIKHRISNIHIANLDGTDVKMFKAESFRVAQNDYVTIGVFHAPRTPLTGNLKSSSPNKEKCILPIVPEVKDIHKIYMYKKFKVNNEIFLYIVDRKRRANPLRISRINDHFDTRTY